jgi:hypothetical protein
MGKPSIFSNDYGQRMQKRRKMRIINTILFILIIISAIYYGREYFNYDFNINFGRTNTNKTADKKDVPKDNIPAQKNDAATNTSNNDSSKTAENSSGFYEYKSPDGKVYEIDYAESGGIKDIIGIKETSGTVLFDISTDKKKIVFCNSTGDVIVGDDKGTFKKVNSDSYKSKSAGVTILKQNVLKNNPQYIWAAKPQFTSDNRIVFLSYLPYINGANTFYLWAVNIDGGSMRMVGKLSNDINKISYEGNSNDKALRIKSDGVMYYLRTGAYGLVK